MVENLCKRDASIAMRYLLLPVTQELVTCIDIWLCVNQGLKCMIWIVSHMIDAGKAVGETFVKTFY